MKTRSGGTRMLKGLVLFLKAATGDLFADRVQVAGHARGSTWVSPYMSTRQKGNPIPFARATAHHRGHTITYPDRAHAMLHMAGRRLAEGGRLKPEERGALWDHFSGYVEDQENAPFASPADVDGLALDYHDELDDELGDGPPRHVSGGSVVDPDRLPDYLRRDLDGTTGQMAKAFPV